MVSEPQKQRRRSAYDLVRRIYDVLPVLGLKTKTEIAHEIGSKPDTVETCLEIIMFVQGQPTLEQVRVGTRRYGYRRARAKKEGAP